MTTNEEQKFLHELEKKLWTSANKLLPSLDASQYKHVVLGLVFLKYVSDSFGIRRDELTEQFKNPANRYFLDPEEFGGEESEDYQAEINTELECVIIILKPMYSVCLKLLVGNFCKTRTKSVSPVK